jgi:hypothetical protein
LDLATMYVLLLAPCRFNHYSILFH